MKKNKQQAIAKQRAIENHQKQLADIRQKRIDNPINIICPRCTAHRNINRKAGSLICPYCDFKEPLPDFHMYIPELDEIGYSHPLNSFNPTKKKLNAWALLSFIIGCFSSITCGLFIIPELLGIIFGFIPYWEKNKNLSVADKALLITGMVLNGISLLFAIIIYIIAIVNPSAIKKDDYPNSALTTTQTSISTEYTTTVSTA